jgi:hypothetical protein
MCLLQDVMLAVVGQADDAFNVLWCAHCRLHIRPIAASVRRKA